MSLNVSAQNTCRNTLVVDQGLSWLQSGCQLGCIHLKARTVEASASLLLQVVVGSSQFLTAVH